MFIYTYLSLFSSNIFNLFIQSIYLYSILSFHHIQLQPQLKLRLINGYGCQNLLLEINAKHLETLRYFCKFSLYDYELIYWNLTKTQQNLLFGKCSLYITTYLQKVSKHLPLVSAHQPIYIVSIYNYIYLLSYLLLTYPSS